MKTKENRYKIVASKQMYKEKDVGSRCNASNLWGCCSSFCSLFYFLFYPQFGHAQGDLDYEISCFLWKEMYSGCLKTKCRGKRMSMEENCIMFQHKVGWRATVGGDTKFRVWESGTFLSLWDDCQLRQISAKWSHPLMFKTDNRAHRT